MKSKYIFPFNQTFLRKKNNQLKESELGGTNTASNNRLIYESKIFCFPFTHVKVPVYALKELQTPITKSMTEVLAVLEEFCSEFPRGLFPLKKKPPSPPKTDKKLPDIRQ